MTERVVQVVFGAVRLEDTLGGHAHSYAYRVPEDWPGMLRGDQVVVPPNWAHPYPQLATVVGFGREGYEGGLAVLTGYVLPRPVKYTGYEGFESEVSTVRELNTIKREIARALSADHAREKLGGRLVAKLEKQLTDTIAIQVEFNQTTNQRFVDAEKRIDKLEHWAEKHYWQHAERDRKPKRGLGLS